MASRILTFLKQYLLIDDQHLLTTDADVWKLSVLRIILLIGVVLTSTIVAHSSYMAYQQQLYYVICLTCGFTLMLWSTLALSKHQIQFASASLTFIIVAAGLCILFFTVDLASSRYGLLFFFTLPIILRLFYGNKAALIGMLVNIIPFIILLRNEPIAPLFGVDITLPDTHTYLSALIFLFFNFCLPVAVIRVMSSLEQQAKYNQKQSLKLEKLVNRYQEIFNNGGLPSFFCDAQGNILQANRSARTLIKTHSSCSTNLYQLFDLKTPLTPGVRQRATIFNRPDCVFEIQPASLEHHKKQLIHCYDISKNAAKAKRFEDFKKQQFTKHYFDELTGLKNHHYWKLAETNDTLTGRYWVLLKLSNLRDINTQYSYNNGDQLLSQIALLLKSQLPIDAGLYRFPGAKFFVSITVPADTTPVITEWIKSFLPTHLVHRSLSTQVSLHWHAGIYPCHNKAKPGNVLEACTIALSQANYQRPYVVFDPNSVTQIRLHSQHKDRVKFLIDNNHLILYLQPQVNLNQDIVGYEVLARLTDPDSSQVLPPSDFIPIVEKYQWHVLFSRKLLEKVLALLSDWPTGLANVPIAINLSGPELLDDVFFEKVLRYFTENPSLRDSLKLELTETSVLSSHLETKRRLNLLANVGAVIIIDDFGTGHASLSQLIDMSASVLKIDREFVNQIEQSERHRKIVNITLELAKSLAMETIAEGVETPAQAHLLQQMGVRIFQGFLYGKPAPVSYWSSKKSNQKVHQLLTN